MPGIQHPPPGDPCRPDQDRAPAPGVARLCVLGRFGLTIAGRPVDLPAPAARLLALLTVPGHPTARRAVASTLWMDVRDDRATANLRNTLWRLAPYAASCLVVSPRAVTLAPTVDVDVDRMRDRCRRLLSPSETPGADDLDVTSLTRDLLPDWDEEWLLYERERLRQLRIHALEAVSRHLSRRRHHAAAIDAAHAALAAEPLRESAHRTLIDAHVAEGNMVEARRQYEACATLLRHELGVGPSRELRDQLARVGVNPGD